MKEIRVLVLSHMYPGKANIISGIFVHHQIESLLKKGAKVRIFSPIPYSPRIFWANQRRRSYGETPQIEVVEGISVSRPRYLRLPGSWFFGPSCLTMYQSVNKLIDSAIREFKPHVIHAYTATPDGYASLLLKKKYGIPLVCSLLGSDINVYPYYWPFTMNFTQKVLSQADKLIAVSHALKIAANRITQPKNKIEVIYMGVDSEKFKYKKEYRNRLRSRIGILLTEPVLMFVGNLIKEKGILELYEAFVQLSERFKNIHLVLVGDGPMHSELNQLINTSNLVNRVHLVGKQSHNKMPEWLSISDIFVLPSYSEGLPNAVIEAMSCERPVIATNVGGIPEAIKNRDTGLLINPYDTKSLVKALQFLLLNPKKAKTIGKNARRLILENYTWEKNAEKTIDIYKQVLNHD